MTDIGVGDLVYVAKPMPCCGDAAMLGHVYKVESITPHHCACSPCGHHLGMQAVAFGDTFGMMVPLLRKFVPESAPTLAEVSQAETLKKALPA